jgi:hypothetical protein
MAVARSTRRAQLGIPAAEAPQPDQMLTAAGRRQVVETFIGLIEGLYAHLPLKRAMYGGDPLQQLRLLRQRAAAIDDHSFHIELWRIVTGLRDAHTLYIGPRSLAGTVARLPFLVEQYAEPGEPHRPRYLVSKIAPGLIDDERFVPGVELTMWNGVPFALAVERHADRETGGRPDARRARAVETLTLRALQYGPPPDEHWVLIGYRADGAERELRLPWQLVAPGEAPGAPPAATQAARARAIDPVGEQLRRAKKLMFKGELWQAEAAGLARRRGLDQAADGTLRGAFADNVSARPVETASGRFGYLRLWSFDLLDDDGYLVEVIDLLARLPSDGLIIDLRSNPGGLIWAAERLLQLFTPHPVQPTRFSMLATELTRAMAQAPQNAGWLGPWAASLEAAVANGELYSQALPITPVPRANDVGQVYGGPVVAVVDPNTYSAGDLFAAGFVDNGLGTLVSVGQATGAGGANVWEPITIGAALSGTPFVPIPLPAGLGYRMSVRRATRIGDADGTAIEDVGVWGDRRYAMTRDDLLADNRDMLEFCGRLLAAEPATGLEVTATSPRLEVTTRGLNRLDVYVDDRPLASVAIANDQATVSVPAVWETLTVEGYHGEVLRQRRRIRR